MKSFKKLVAYVLTLAITVSFINPLAGYAEGEALISPNPSLVSSSDASANASKEAQTASSDASKDASSNASEKPEASATTEAASAEAISGDASKDAASADASKEASSNATGTTETAIVSITFAKEGKVVVGNDADKTLMAAQKVKVTDIDKDGKLTINDAFSIADTTYSLGGFEATAGWITKIFGISTSNTGIYVNATQANSTLDAITAGDVLVGFIYKDTTGFSDK